MKHYGGNNKSNNYKHELISNIPKMTANTILNKLLKIMNQALP